MTKAQREKVAAQGCCVGCNWSEDFALPESGFKVDPAHLWPRSLGGCDHPDCVIPLCRRCHQRLDDPSDAFDLYAKLTDRGYWKELAHAIEVHEVGLLTLAERLTGQRYAPVEGVAA